MKEIKFDRDNIDRNIINQVISEEVIDEINQIKVNGLKKVVIGKLKQWDYSGIDIDYDIKLTESQVLKCQQLHNEKYEAKKKRVQGLIEKCDFLFHDLKSYIKMKPSFDESTYCGVETECENLISKYTKSRATSYATYRIRNSEYNKMKCL